MDNYDSTKDTMEHRNNIYNLLNDFCVILKYRADIHDWSKFESPEKELFDKYTPLLSKTVYGSDEYKKYLKEMGKALDHHYENNSHHPEHTEFGINGMTLIDIIEMFCDWKAASMRHKDGNFIKSIIYNRDRFEISQQLIDIFENTAKELYGET